MNMNPANSERLQQLQTKKPAELTREDRDELWRFQAQKFDVIAARFSLFITAIAAIIYAVWGWLGTIPTTTKILWSQNVNGEKFFLALPFAYSRELDPIFIGLWVYILIKIGSLRMFHDDSILPSKKFYNDELVLALTAALTAALTVGLIVSLIIVIGLGTGLFAGLSAGLGTGLFAGLSAGLGAGLFVGLDAGLGAGLFVGLPVGLIVSLIVGLGAGVLSGFGLTFPIAIIALVILRGVEVVVFKVPLNLPGPIAMALKTACNFIRSSCSKLWNYPTASE